MVAQVAFKPFWYSSVMTQIHESRQSNSPYIETIWRSRNLTDGIYLATPDGSWDLIVMIDEDGRKQAALTGQATEPMDVPYRAGTSSVVISFTPGAYLPHYPAETLLDGIEMLSNFDDDHFSLAGHTFTFPTFENAEELIAAMVKLGILQNDRVVDKIVRDRSIAISDRARQRHFVETTGMTQASLKQIKRAQEAVKLLKQGKKPIDVAVDTGYTDQSHLAKSLKRIMRSKPSDVDDIHKL